MSGAPTPVRRFQHALFRAGQWVLGHRGGPEHDIEPGLSVVGKDAGTRQVRLWIGALVHGCDAETLDATVTVSGAAGDARVTTTLLRFGFDDERAVSGWRAGTRFFHGHVVVDRLAPDAWGEAAVELAPVPGLREEHRRASCRVRTLPSRIAVGGSLTALVGSCYDADTDTTNALDAAFRHLRDHVAAPDIALLTGDQVYADAPAKFYATMARSTPRTYGLLEYWTSWGMQRYGERRHLGMRELLGHGPHWFLPDDHEFWNNWPHASVTARHSYSNIGRAGRGGLLRRLAVWRHRRAGPDAPVPCPADPGPPPTDPLVQSYHPVHPDEWDTWGRAAFDLYGSFQTPSVRDRDTGRITRGELDDDPAADPLRPPRHGPPGEVHRPLNQLVQRIDLDEVQIVLLDTRTRRTRRTDDPRHSGFVDAEYLDRVLAIAADAAVLVLVTPQPMLVPPYRTRLRERPLGARVEKAIDLQVADYPDQYARFWDGVVAARDGRPTVTVGGDIHSSYVGHAPSLPLLEVVSSPMSLVAGSTLFETVFAAPAKLLRAMSGGSAHRDPYAPGAPLARIPDLRSRAVRAPEPGDEPVAVSLTGLGRGNPEGIGLLSLSRPGEHRFELTASLHLRASLAAGNTDGARRVRVELRTDRRGPEAMGRPEVGPPLP
ncbi:MULTISPECIES: hypothetical protein [unclassified Pseudonocardia]|uniref:hypothetical protein n=1 Tax=unclassified Pseudonocardia TaxID=2619320 RepID=UPI0001FFE131|nr:hypothetical protein [Pseudonocardia sp. Ae707_Ps1]OLM20172.1 hypothetical protein Ae707Ps1_4431 [Pseudonocardia sp. Ae707_Ps1]